MFRIWKKCWENDKVKNMFPIKRSKHQMEMRKTDKFKTVKANTKKLKIQLFHKWEDYWTKSGGKNKKSVIIWIIDKIDTADGIFLPVPVNFKYFE